ncbi:hypothetical protein FisN_10Lh267 [Fistulifera solaris]|uniref:PDEase domain-containing protein n=1 Tax=Fistulifera solaris TaxID=1519565 RepID=A0A1Z5KG74_FISSO|nr:hypothetical protein FisN_10Lh267 [Fistulifera solaris]|eukprot:GAX25071.1 hypothetical protein FisN_10Lh267 [Fistulifera solaris]
MTEPNDDDAPTPVAPIATLALALTVEEWHQLGLQTGNPDTEPTNDLEKLVDRATALLFIRCVAVVAPLGTYPDLSTSNICRTTLMKQTKWPKALTALFYSQLREFVKRIIAGYKDVPYHNREHGFHVLLSVNKMIDMMVSQQTGQKSPVTFGLRHDPVALLALLYAALIHDVEHQGIPNRQLAQEDDRLAVLYNDQSIAENWSIYVAFSELLQDEFQLVRTVIFPEKDEYFRFRKIVVNLVLTTDIASPERSQLVKSKWKEAFGDPIETIERKMKAQARRMSLTGQNVAFRRHNRRGTGDTGTSEVSFEQPDDQDSPTITPEGSENGDVEETKMELPSNWLDHRRRSITHRIERRRSSMASRNSTSSKYRQRLGILRTVDLSGETLETYTRTGSLAHSAASDPTTYGVDLESDESDDLKATVVMETIMLAADVAHNLQGWDHMVKFSNRLYMELRTAYVKKRGTDPETRWFENQIGFLESYLLPLAHRLDDTGVFGERNGEQFAANVIANRDKWLIEGLMIAQKIVQEGAEKLPLPDN